MKYKVAELMNRINKRDDFDEIISFKNKIDGVEIIDVEDTHVTGHFEYIKSDDGFMFYLTISTVLTCPCAITLKPVKLLVDFDTNLFYTFKVVDDDSFPIVNNTIELDEEIWGEIIMSLPSRILSDGAVYEEKDEIKVEKENPFSSLVENDEED